MNTARCWAALISACKAAASQPPPGAAAAAAGVPFVPTASEDDALKTSLGGSFQPAGTVCGTLGKDIALRLETEGIARHSDILLIYSIPPLKNPFPSMLSR